MNKRSFALRGTVCWSRADRSMETRADAFVVCEGGACAGVFDDLPERYQNIPVEDYTGKLIVPGFVDLHVHAPQYTFRGLGMNMELIDWLNTHTFPEEAKYADLDYARRAYSIFVEDLVKSPTTRACIFGTVHVPATLLLMELLERSGLRAMVGKVNMDRNAPENLVEGSVDSAVENTRRWLEESRRFERVQPILTPRFVPSVTDELMAELGKLQREYGVPVQSHLSENLGEVEWVKELSPKSRFYGDAYDRFGLFGGACPTVMAHSIYSTEEEIALIAERGVFVAHCPASNTNLSSGIAPVRHLLNAGVRMGLGSDVAGGHSLSLLRACADAVQCSKLRWRLTDQSMAPLTAEEAFFLATRGGGAFFGKVGSFEPGFCFDALVLDDSAARTPLELTPEQRLRRSFYLGGDCRVQAKFVDGEKVY